MTVASVTKIMAPITWDLQPKFQIQDLSSTRHEEVVRLIKHHYLRDEPMCRSVQLLKDPWSSDSYLELVRSWLKDTCSLVAISEQSGRAVGVAVCTISSQADRTDVYSRVLTYDGEAIESIVQLKNTLTAEARIYETLGHDAYLRIRVLCVHPSYKRKGVARALIEASCLAAYNMQIPVIAGIFTSSEDQASAEQVGLSVLAEIAYSNWLIDGEVVFDDPGVGNYTAALMYVLTPDEEALKRNKEMRGREEKSELIKKSGGSRGK